MDRFFNYNLKNKKKSIISFEAIIGTVLSMVALFLIFQVFIDAFYHLPNNQKVADANAESFVHFIDYSKNDLDISSFNDCFLMLRLFNLENFQFKEEKDEDNYFYIINNFGVFVVKNENFESFFKNQKFNDEPDFKFDSEVKIVEDNTEEAWKVENLWFWKIHEADKKIKYKFSNSNYLIMLKPKLGKLEFQNEFEISLLDLSGNILLNDDLNLNDDKHYLVYDTSNNYLFVSKHLHSNILIKKNLCVKKYLISKDLNNYYLNNPDKVDFINNKIIFSCSADKKKIFVKGNYEWLNGVVCNDIDKVGMCKEINPSLIYVDFFNKLKKNCYNVLNGENFIEFSIKIEPLKLSEIKKNNNIKYNDIFENFKYETNFDNKKLNIDEYKLLKNDFNDIRDKGFSDLDITDEIEVDTIKSIYNKINEKLVYDNTNFFNKYFDFDGKKFNDCYDKFSNYIIYLNNEAYFFVDGCKSKNSNKKLVYAKFKNYDFIKKLNTGQKDKNGNIIYDFYFNTEKIKAKRVETDKDNEGFFENNNKFFYFLKINNIESKDYDIILSEKQFENIREIKK